MAATVPALTCPVCLDSYRAPDRCAYTAPCGHTACEPCLTSMIQRGLECAVCRVRLPPLNRCTRTHALEGAARELVGNVHRVQRRAAEHATHAGEDCPDGLSKEEQIRQDEELARQLATEERRLYEQEQEKLRERAEIEQRRREPCHNVFQAAERGSLEMLQHWLFERGASVDDVDKAKCTPLHLASLNGHKEATELLVARWANVNAKEQYMRTPLHLAATNGHLEVSEILITQGGNVDVTDDFSRTALHCAAANGHDKVAELLVHHGGAIDCRDNCSRTPLHLAAENGHADVAELLVSWGAGVNAQNKDIRTPLHLAALNGHYQVAEMLMTRWASVNGVEQHRRTPLHLASLNGHGDVAEALIKRGGNVDATDEHGATPLHLAAAKGHANLARLLVSNGADPTAKDVVARSPADVATSDAVRAVLEQNHLLYKRPEHRQLEPVPVLGVVYEGRHPPAHRPASMSSVPTIQRPAPGAMHMRGDMPGGNGWPAAARASYSDQRGHYGGGRHEANWL